MLAQTLELQFEVTALNYLLRDVMMVTLTMVTVAQLIVPQLRQGGHVTQLMEYNPPAELFAVMGIF